MNLKSIYTTFTNRFLWWVFVSTYFLFVYMPRLLMEGMFGDGLTYASIARNMAIGKGTFWAPYFSSSFWLAYNKTEVFYEHPPLAMYFQSLLFKVFGDQLFVEKLYCLMVCGFTIWAISLLWRTVFSESNFKDWDWLPTVIWLGMPEVEWSVANNMLDNTQTMFCIWATYFCFISLKNGQKSWMAIVSGASIFLGILSKGPVSLFVVAVPWIYWFIMDRKTKVFQISFYQIMGLGVPLVYCILDSDAYNFLSKYIQQQFLSAILGNREITEGGSDLKAHLHIFSAIYTQISPGLVLLLLGVVWLLGKRGVQVVRSFSPNQTFRVAWFFFILAMSGSFPIALSVKQADYYLLPSSPFYALGLGVSFVYFMEKLQLTTWQIIPKIWHVAIISLVF
ncbi:MAG: glycosyltransferase family 39 protein, partial [Cytophagales bacterium]|nr:glycosyltransferase family 39 protein [Cytophagales bacterium]